MSFRAFYGAHGGGGGSMVPFDAVVAVEKVGFYAAIRQRLKPLPE